VQDISTLEGALSISGLQFVFDRMKAMEKKHKNEIKSLEALLG